mmetsp:Transcript_1563/g.5373  ORF Transcript_1563/g.5373 Transcript_1563/m.5373 type:complete len:424 (-) Transcript_1563:1029-2300(-)
MNRPYYDSYSYRYAESQLDNERLRRHIRELKGQVQNLKWYTDDLKNEKSRDTLRIAEDSRYLSSKLNNLEYTLTDLRHENYMTKKEANLEIKKLNEEISTAQTRVNNLEWLNEELRKEKAKKAKLAAELEYETTKKSTEVYKTRRELEDERKRAESLERLNSSLNSDYFKKSLELKDREKKISELEFKTSTLSSDVYSKELKLKESESKILNLEDQRSQLLSETFATKQELNETRSRLQDTELSKSLLEKSLHTEQREAEFLRSKNVELSVTKTKYERQLQQHDQMFRSMYEDSMRQLENTRNNVITAEKNLELSRVDPATYEYDYVDRKYETLRRSTVDVNSTLNDIKGRLNRSTDASDLNSSTSFTNYYENKYGASTTGSPVEKSRLYEDIERDLRMYRMERSLNDSLERLKKWQNSSRVD